MMDWFNNLEQRERKMVLWGVGVLLLIILYLIVLEPLYKQRQDAYSRFQTKVKLMEFMQDKSGEVAQLRQGLVEKSKRPTDKKLAFLVERSLQQSAIDKNIKSIVPQSRGALQLRFDTVNFDRFINWLVSFHNRYGVNVDKLTVSETADIGLVRVSVLLN